MKRIPGGFPALLFAVLAAAPAALAEEPDPGPPVPGTRSLYLLDVPFLHFGPQDTSLLRAGKLAFGLEWSYGNTFSHTWHPQAIHNEFGRNGLALSREEAETLHERHPQDVIALIDGEVNRFALRAAYGLSDRFSVAVELPYVSFGAPHMDRAIESFHGALGLDNGQRESFPRNSFMIVRQRAFGPLEYEDRMPTAGLGDLTASLRWRDRLENGLLLSADLTVKAPTGDADEYRGSGSVDGGLLVGAAYRLGASRRWGVRVEAGVVVPGRYRGNTVTTFDPSTFFRLFAACDVRIGKRTFVAVTVAVEQSPFRHEALGDGALTAAEVALGVSHRFGDGVLASVALTENVPRYGDAADVALTLSLKLFP